ncbi:unnamed protein product [Owenia fusiformis]|uniref:Uncharacterized protein n=1 Tax=Owenia fusiformis TaxID=6347 RepID=A0A8S4NRY3_OWEFU|nr:unnamed protein product [Owenia fusiformis]
MYEVTVKEKKVAPWGTLLKDFSQDTSFHGVRYTGIPGTHPLRRIIWMIITIGMFAAFLVVISLRIHEYFQYNMTVNLEVKDGALDLPSVTICNHNFLRASKVYQSGNFDTVSEAFQESDVDCTSGHPLTSYPNNTLTIKHSKAAIQKSIEIHEGITREVCKYLCIKDFDCKSLVYSHASMTCYITTFNLDNSSDDVTLVQSETEDYYEYCSPCNSTTEFECAYGDKCIDKALMCDGVADCADSSDEIGTCWLNTDFTFYIEWGFLVDTSKKIYWKKMNSDSEEELLTGLFAQITGQRNGVYDLTDAFTESLGDDSDDPTAGYFLLPSSDQPSDYLSSYIETATLISPVVSGSLKTQRICYQLSYKVYISTEVQDFNCWNVSLPSSMLQISRSYLSNGFDEPLWNIKMAGNTACDRTKWHKVAIDIPPAEFDYYILVKTTNEQLPIAIDNQLISPEACASQGCPSNMFECMNGHCIPNQALCNGTNDCGDGSDETETRCSNTHINCDFENTHLCGWVIPPEGGDWYYVESRTQSFDFYNDGMAEYWPKYDFTTQHRAVDDYSVIYDDACESGQLITSSEGFIQSIGYGTLDYGNYLNCVWTISSSDLGVGQVRKLQIIGLDIEILSNCAKDYLKIETPGGGTLWKGCGSLFEEMAVTTSLGVDLDIPVTNEDITITFFTDGWNTGEGFKIAFTTHTGPAVNDPLDPFNPLDITEYGTVENPLHIDVVHGGIVMPLAQTGTFAWSINTSDPNKVIQVDIRIASPYDLDCTNGDNIQINDAMGVILTQMCDESTSEALYNYRETVLSTTNAVVIVLTRGTVTLEEINKYVVSFEYAAHYKPGHMIMGNVVSTGTAENNFLESPLHYPTYGVMCITIHYKLYQGTLYVSTQTRTHTKLVLDITNSLSNTTLWTEAKFELSDMNEFKLKFEFSSSFSLNFVMIDETQLEEGSCDCNKYLESPDGAEYTGDMARTEDGYTCQSWNLNSPHQGLYSSQPSQMNYPSGYFESNYCRNPDGSTKPWCYTTDLLHEKDDCDIETCAYHYTELTNYCYSYDSSAPTFFSLENFPDPDLAVATWERDFPIYACYLASKRNGFEIFALYGGGKCAGGLTAYNQSQVATPIDSALCANDSGLGSTSTYHVYKVIFDESKVIKVPTWESLCVALKLSGETDTGFCSLDDSMKRFLYLHTSPTMKSNYLPEIEKLEVKECDRNCNGSCNVAGWWRCDDQCKDGYVLSEADKVCKPSSDDYMSDFLLTKAHDANDLIFSCSWDVGECSSESFVLTHTDYGQCYTFNTSISTVTKTGASSGQYK